MGLQFSQEFLNRSDHGVLGEWDILEKVDYWGKGVYGHVAVLCTCSSMYMKSVRFSTCLPALNIELTKFGLVYHVTRV